jgi:hypothetical protein
MNLKFNKNILKLKKYIKKQVRAFYIKLLYLVYKYLFKHLIKFKINFRNFIISSFILLFFPSQYHINLIFNQILLLIFNLLL